MADIFNNRPGEDLKSRLDQHGNILGSEGDLARDGAFSAHPELNTVAVLHLYTGEGFDFKLPTAALEKKGFRVKRWENTPPPPAELRTELASCGQLWVVSTECRALSKEHIDVIREFFDRGRGVFLLADNEPYLHDASAIGMELVGAKLVGNLPGEKLVKRRPHGAKGETPGFGSHPITHGLDVYYEGVTISTVEIHDERRAKGLKNIVIGSDGKPVTAAFDDGSRRLLLDGGFTRLFLNWDRAGTARFVVNAATWLANVERFLFPWMPAPQIERSGLTIRVVAARNLIAADVGGTSDPYVVIKDVSGLAGKGAKTSVKKKTLNPAWGEEFRFQFSYKLSCLRFKCYDQDRFSADDPLGECFVPISTISDGAMHDVWLPLQLKKKPPKGELNLQLQVHWAFPIAVPGSWVPIQTPIFTAGLGWGFSKKKTPVDLDASCAILDTHNTIMTTVSFRNRLAFEKGIAHLGDSRTGECDGDDESIVVDLTRLPPAVEKIVFVINSYTGAPICTAKSAYMRIFDPNRTLAFARIDSLTPTPGLLFGYFCKAPDGAWFFQTINRGIQGNHLEASLPEVIAFINQIAPARQ